MRSLNQSPTNSHPSQSHLQVCIKSTQPRELTPRSKIRSSDAAHPTTLRRLVQRRGLKQTKVSTTEPPASVENSNEICEEKFEERTHIGLRTLRLILAGKASPSTERISLIRTMCLLDLYRRNVTTRRQRINGCNSLSTTMSSGHIQHIRPGVTKPRGWALLIWAWIFLYRGTLLGAIALLLVETIRAVWEFLLLWTFGVKGQSCSVHAMADTVIEAGKGRCGRVDRAGLRGGSRFQCLRLH